jgi:hypothetical protein
MSYRHPAATRTRNDFASALALVCGGLLLLLRPART